jgi:hypothetical protein
VRLDAGIVPALTGLVIHNEHPVDKLLTEAQLRLIFNMRLEGFKGENLQFHALTPSEKLNLPLKTSYFFITGDAFCASE